jgi:hypothetical protein
MVVMDDSMLGYQGSKEPLLTTDCRPRVIEIFEIKILLMTVCKY